MWQEQLEDILRRRTERRQNKETNSADGYPPMQLLRDNGEHITITPVQVYHFQPDTHWQRRRGTRCVRSSHRLIVEASTLPPTLSARYQGKGSLQPGARIEPSASYILRALAKMEAAWCVYRREGHVLAVIPHHHLYSLLDLIHDEDQYETSLHSTRYCRRNW